MLTIVKKLFERLGFTNTDENSVDDQLSQHNELIDPQDGLERCLDCYGTEFYDGPSGGMSANIKCVNCGSEFNSCGGLLPLDRINWIDHTIVFKNFILFESNMINDWHTIIIHDFNSPFPKHIHHMQKTNSEFIEIISDIYDWCKTSIQGKWSIKSYFLYFELKEDAIIFKLKWC